MVWIVRHYRAVIAFVSLALTGIIAPGAIFMFNFFIDSKASQASVMIHDAKITKIEEAVYRTDEKFLAIKRSLDRIEDREFQELKQARQLRLLNK